MLFWERVWASLELVGGRGFEDDDDDDDDDEDGDDDEGKRRSR